MTQRFGNRWEINRSLGEGGQAHTFLVRDLHDEGDTGEKWVLKRLKNEQRLGRFELEVEALATIESDRIPAIEDYSVQEPAFLVIPYLGIPLHKVVQKEKLSFDEGLDIVRDVAEAVVVAHQAGIIHRDIKPNNVIVDEVARSG